LEYCNSGAAEKARMMPLVRYYSVKSVTICLDTVLPALVRQTDEIGKSVSRSACIVCWRDKNVFTAVFIVRKHAFRAQRDIALQICPFVGLSVRQVPAG